MTPDRSFEIEAQGERIVDDRRAGPDALDIDGVRRVGGCNKEACLVNLYRQRPGCRHDFDSATEAEHGSRLPAKSLQVLQFGGYVAQDESARMRHTTQQGAQRRGADRTEPHET